MCVLAQRVVFRKGREDGGKWLGNEDLVVPGGWVRHGVFLRDAVRIVLVWPGVACSGLTWLDLA